MNNEINSEGLLSEGYGIIPKKTMKDQRLSIEAKAIYGFICSYAGKGDSAFPSVRFICHCLGISERRFYNHRKSLVDLGYIRIENRYDGQRNKTNVYRIIFDHLRFDSNHNESGQDDESQNDRSNNNSTINNSFKSNSQNKALIEVINYLNKATAAHYKPTTKKTKTLIHARLHEGFTILDFKKVIDKKTSQWLDDPKMNKYLRPETLFGPKFEGYLNEKGRIKNEKVGGDHTDDYAGFLDF
ncbi:MAG: conserved phage C-terminal domain-containing protein [Sporolactobacillus sp.]